MLSCGLEEAMMVIAKQEKVQLDRLTASYVEQRVSVYEVLWVGVTQYRLW